MGLLVDEAGWTIEDLRWVTINAMKSAFIPFDERLAIIEGVVKPGYARLLGRTARRRGGELVRGDHLARSPWSRSSRAASRARRSASTP